jgi:trigger factor
MTLTSNVEEINSVQKRISIAVGAPLVSQAFDDVYKNLQKKAKLQGFRPGKAPLSMIKKLYSDSVRGDVVEKLINKHLFDVLKEKKINPVTSPVVEKINEIASDKEFSFSAIVDVMPEIKVKDYRGMSFSVEKHTVNDDAITKEIDYLRRRQAKTKSVADNATAAVGHLATIGHKVFHESNLIENMDVQEFPVALGFNEIFKDLEDAIIGMKVGETKKSVITLPKDYNDPSLAGKAVDFEITLKTLQELTLPNFDDEFAKDIGLTSADELKTNITTQMAKHHDKNRKQKLESMIMEELRKRNSFDVPPSIVDQVIDDMIRELNVPDENEKKKLLKNEDLRKSFRDTAKIKAQNTLMLWRIAQDEKIEVNDDVIRSYIKDNMPGTEKWDDTKLNDLVKAMKPKLQDNLIFERTVDYLISQSKITDIAP